MALVSENIEEIWDSYDAERASSISSLKTEQKIENAILKAKENIISAILEEGNYRCVIEFNNIYNGMSKNGVDYNKYKDSINVFKIDLETRGFKTNLEDYSKINGSTTDEPAFKLEVIWRMS